jgi:hypothetical protein
MTIIYRSHFESPHLLWLILVPIGVADLSVSNFSIEHLSSWNTFLRYVAKVLYDSRVFFSRPSLCVGVHQK